MKALQNIMSNKMQRASIFIVLAIVLIALFSFLVKMLSNKNLNNPIALQTKELQKDTNTTSTNFNKNSMPKNEGHSLFYFNPNTASELELHQLGFTDYNIKTITNYRNKGGRFYEQDDIKKIWGLNKELVEKLLPYVQITGMQKKYEPKTYSTEKFNPNKPNEPISKNEEQNNATEIDNSYPLIKQEKRTNIIIDINQADTTILQSLYGIGPSFARRIVAYRDKLGGYVNQNQLREVYGLNDTIFLKIQDKISLSTGVYKFININTATVDEIKQHPYLRNPLAKVIVAYREMHGNFKSIEDIKKVQLITEEIAIKIEPYLRY